MKGLFDIYGERTGKRIVLRNIFVGVKDAKSDDEAGKKIKKKVL